MEKYKAWKNIFIFANFQMIGFLNFFLWTSDLWFLYKETVWFQNRGQIYNQQMPAQPNPYEQQQQFTQQYNQEYGQMDYGQSSYGQAPM